MTDMPTFSIHDIKGVIPALVTPFDEHEEFDPKRMEQLIEWLIQQKVTGFYLTGSTGEGFLMTPEERKLAVETAVKAVNHRVPVIVHVGAISTKISIDLARHAEQAGADAISSVPPFYWHFSEDAILAYYRDIAASTSLPLIIYNVPLAGLMGFGMIEKLSKLPGVAGIKYTATTHQDIYRCKDEISPKFMVYSGADEMAVSGIFNGADGIIGSFYTMLPDLFVRLYDDMKNGRYEDAQRLQKIAVSIINASLKTDYYAAIKETTRWMGVDAGYVRRPFRTLNAEQIETLKQDFRAIRKAYQADDILVLKAAG